MAHTSVASTTTSTSLLATDTARTSVIICNDDANRLYVLIGSGTASATNYSFSLAQNENAELRDGAARDQINGVWSADGSGYAQLSTSL